MRYNFTIATTTHKSVREGRLRKYVKEPVTIIAAIAIEGKVCKLGYGYKYKYTQHNEGCYSSLPGRKYVLHESMQPKEGDVWTYGGRTFVVGKKIGFLCYQAPLLEHGRQVATIEWEDYYKD